MGPPVCRSIAVGFGGIILLISGLWKFCGGGTGLFTFGWMLFKGGGGGGDWIGPAFEGGGGGGGIPPGGKTGVGKFGCMAAKADGGNCPGGWANGDCLGSDTPSACAFRLIRRAIRGDFICDKSSPPGVYVNGFLSFVIIAFCTQAGGSKRLSGI